MLTFQEFVMWKKMSQLISIQFQSCKAYKFIRSLRWFLISFFWTTLVVERSTYFEAKIWNSMPFLILFVFLSPLEKRPTYSELFELCRYACVSLFKSSKFSSYWSASKHSPIKHAKNISFQHTSKRDAWPFFLVFLKSSNSIQRALSFEVWTDVKGKKKNYWFWKKIIFFVSVALKSANSELWSN